MSLVRSGHLCLLARSGYPDYTQPPFLVLQEAPGAAPCPRLPACPPALAPLPGWVNHVSAWPQRRPVPTTTPSSSSPPSLPLPATRQLLLSHTEVDLRVLSPFSSCRSRPGRYPGLLLSDPPASMARASTPCPPSCERLYRLYTALTGRLSPGSLPADGDSGPPGSQRTGGTPARGADSPATGRPGARPGAADACSRSHTRILAASRGNNGVQPCG